MHAGWLDSAPVPLGLAASTIEGGPHVDRAAVGELGLRKVASELPKAPRTPRIGARHLP